MSQAQSSKYSIKQQMAAEGGRKTTVQATANLKTATDKIYMPEHYNCFLQTVEREIRHEGDLLSRIKRSIQGLKSQKGLRKGCQNGVNAVSHNAPTKSLTSQLHARNKTADPAGPPIAIGKPAKRSTNSASVSVRATLKLKTSSFTTEFPKKESNTRCLSREISNILFNARPLAKTDQFYQQTSFERFESPFLSHKKSKTGVVEMAVSGNKPQWGHFECYRNNSALLARKYC